MNYKTYLITSKDSGKQYVGITKSSIEYRFNQHARDAKRGSELALHRAMRKRGLERFSVEVIRSGMGEEQAKDQEKSLIKSWQTMAPKGYNMTPGGDGCVDLSPESKEKKREAIRIKHSDPKFKKRHSESCKLSFTQERRQKISHANKGKGMHPNAMAAILEAKKAPEYREKASKVAKEKWDEPGYKEKWKEAKKQSHIQKAKRFPAREDGLIFSSTRRAAEYMKDSGWGKAAPNNICLACNGKYKSSCGYSWSWIDGDKAREIGGII